MQDARANYRLVSLAGVNAAAVAALYLGQVLAKTIAGDFATDNRVLSLVPGATLVGYAIGVSLIAFIPAGKIGLSIPAHIRLLAVALCAASIAPNAITLALASVAIGAGASVAQRLLAAAGKLGGAMRGGTFIGKTICVALTAILGIRLVGDVAAQLVGWRTVFLAAAAIVSVFGTLSSWMQPGVLSSRSAPSASFSRIAPLWRQSAMLRWAMFQHGALFAAYNLAWMTILVEVPAQERAAVVIGGGGTGLIAALLAGYCVDRFVQRDLARYGAAAVAIATALALPFAYSSTPGFDRVLLLLPSMALLDGGLQVALVANQSRVQALLPDARPRLAALLTVCGSMGGAAGAGLAYWSCQQFDLQVPIGLAALSGLFGFACAMLARSKRLNDCAMPIGQRPQILVNAVSRSAALQEPADGSLYVSVEWK